MDGLRNTQPDYRRALAGRRRVARALVAAGSIALAGCTACGGGDQSGTGPEVPGTPVPNALVGQWQGAFSAGGALGNDFFEDTYDLDGVTLPDASEVTNNTLGYGWYFNADGRYEHIWVWQAFVGYCGRTIAWEERGTVRFSGDLSSGAKIDFNPTEAYVTIADQCGPSSQKRADGERMTLTAKRERDKAGRDLLRLRFPSGNDLVLNRPGQH